MVKCGEEQAGQTLVYILHIPFPCVITIQYLNTNSRTTKQERRSREAVKRGDQERRSTESLLSAAPVSSCSSMQELILWTT